MSPALIFPGRAGAIIFDTSQRCRRAWEISLTDFLEE